MTMIDPVEAWLARDGLPGSPMTRDPRPRFIRYNPNSALTTALQPNGSGKPLQRTNCTSIQIKIAPASISRHSVHLSGH